MEDDAEYVVGPDRFVILHYNAHQRQLKREEVLAQMDDFEAQHLYRPRITKKAKELAARAAQRPGSPDTFERLHQYVEVKKVNRQVLEREVFKDCTFQPVVNPPLPRSRSPSPERRRAAEEQQQLPFPDRLHPSEEEQRERRQRLEAAKLQGEVRGCTFQPRVNKSRASDAEMMGMGGEEEGDEGSAPVYERLTKYHAARQMRLDMLKQMKEEEEMRDVTFQPVLYHPSRRRAPSPAAARRGGGGGGGGAAGGMEDGEMMDVYQRLHAQQPHRQQQQQQQQQRGAAGGVVVHKDPECTFQPKLEAALKRRQCSSFEELPMQERFQRYDQYKEAQRARRAREKEEEERKECTFKPALIKSPWRGRRRREQQAPAAAGTAPSSPTRALANNPEVGGEKGAAGDFWEQQSEPDLSTSQRLQQHELTTRLAASWRRRDDERRKLKVEREMQGCTFRPTINSGKTPRKVKDEPVIARLLEAGAAAKKKQHDRKREKEKKEMERCTFQPSLVATARYKSPPRDPSDPPSSIMRRGRSRSPKRRTGGGGSPRPTGRASSRAGRGGPWSAPRAAWGGGHHQYRRRPSSVDRASLSSGRGLRSVSDRHRSYSPPAYPWSGGTSGITDGTSPANINHNPYYGTAMPPALAPVDDDSLRLELNAALPSPESLLLGGGGGVSSPRHGGVARSTSTGSSSAMMMEVGSRSPAELLPPGERLRRFKEWRKQVAARIDSL